MPPVLQYFLIEDNKKSSTSGLELVSENPPHACSLTMSHLKTSLFPFWPTFNLNPNQYIQPTAHRCQNTLFLDVILKIIFLPGYFLLKIIHFFQYSVNTHIANNIFLYIMILEHSFHKILYKKGSPLQWWARIFEYLNIQIKWPSNIICICICAISPVRIYLDIHS